MKTIWKYEFETNNLVRIDIPKGYKILTLQTQNGQPCIWVLVDPENPKEPVAFRVIGTGHPIQNAGFDKSNYIGTYQQNDGALIFHLFKV